MDHHARVTADDSSETPGAPRRLGRYAVRRRLGSGAFATVWLAYDEQLDSPVAVKVLAENWAGDPQVQRRFLEEGRYLRRVDSPHVVGVYDAGELDDGRSYLVMAYADQGSLADRLAAGGLSVAQSLDVLTQVAAGLQALHDRDVVHRDVKPANVLFRTDSSGAVRVMLGDLGLGKALDASSRLTMVAGTPSYVAPEQARAETPTARADQYSLGVLAYLLLSGRAAYTHETLQQAARPTPPAPLGTQERPFPDAADAVVRRALAESPDDRWPDVTGFVAALAEAVGDQVGAAAPLALDPDVTMAGASPSLPTPTPLTPGADPATRRRGRLARLGALAASLVLCAGAVAGGVLLGQDVAADRAATEVEVTDDSGTLGVTVPVAWDGVVGTDGWQPPSSELRLQALAVGTDAGWTDPGSDGSGVFLGLLEGGDLPELMPGHPECDATAPPITEAGPNPATTVVHSGCPGGVTVERVVQVAANRLLWVQVRSPDTRTANRVLDSVVTYGL